MHTTTTTSEETKKVFADDVGTGNDDDDDDYKEPISDFVVEDLEAFGAGAGSSSAAAVMTKQGNKSTGGDDGTTTTDWAAGDRGSIKSIKSIMRSKKENDRYELDEDVYSFIFVAPICSMPFLFSCYVVALKLIVFGILSTDINYTGFVVDKASATVAKFFLIPVAIAMQEDLMKSYFCAANITYCPSILKISKSSTKGKLLFSLFLRTVDGIFSLAVNFFVMLTSDTVLSVFLNFAALQFLQSIDDVFYELVAQGFFGDGMEHMSTLCKRISFPRRTGNDNEKKFCFFLRISHLDTIMFGFTFLICLAIYIIFVIDVYDMFDVVGGVDDNE